MVLVDSTPTYKSCLQSIKRGKLTKHAAKLRSGTGRLFNFEYFVPGPMMFDLEVSFVYKR